jgi:hypothetical protein
MSITATSGMLAMGLQTDMETVPTTFYKHKALSVELAISDDTRVGSPEIGGIPTPSFPYKAGVAVGGGVSLQPRLENTIGYWLKAVMGDLQTNLAMDSQTLSGQTVVHEYFFKPYKAMHPRVITSATTSGSFIVTGTVSGSSGQTELLTLTSGSNVTGTKLFTEITSMSIPNDGVKTAKLFWFETSDEAYCHIAKFNQSSPGYIPWVSFLKYIPPSDLSGTTDLWEYYQDCKIMGMSLNLPNSDPITADFSVLGRKFKFGDDLSDIDPGLASTDILPANYEDWASIPVAVHTDGYIKLGDLTLPVVGASVGMVNAPLDPRQERVYGDPFLNDVTVVSRALTFQLLVKWQNPDLYRAIITGTDTGLEWTSTPFTGSFEVNCVSSVNMDFSVQTPEIPYGLYINCPSALLAMKGGITLAANQSVLMTFTGTALSNAGEYAYMRLTNKVASYS